MLPGSNKPGNRCGMEPAPSSPAPWPEPAPAAPLCDSPVHRAGMGIYSPNPPLLGFMPFLLLHPCLLSYTLSSIYTQYFNLPLGLSQSPAKPGRATPLTSRSIGAGSWPSWKQAVLTGLLLISHLKSHLPALHPFWLLFIDFPANALNLSCFVAQLCCSGPWHVRALLPATAMLSCHLPAFQEPLHTAMVASPFPAPTSSDVVAQGCPHHSYHPQVPSWFFSLSSLPCPSGTSLCTLTSPFSPVKTG